MGSHLPLILAAGGGSSSELLAFHAYLTDVLVLLVGAMLLGGGFERFRQSAIVGYLLAGTVLGPNALGLVRHEEVVSVIAELGVALLLFSIGLEFSWPRLRSMGVRTLLSGFAQVGLTVLGAAAIGAALGLSLKAAVTVGAIVSLSSTAVVLRTLQDRGEIDSIHGRSSMGILIVQDIAVVPLVLLVELLRGGDAAGGGEAGGLAAAGMKLAWALAAGAGLVLVFALAARYGLPRLIKHPTISKNRELPILFAIICGVGSAWAAFSVGLSPALGAFIAGVILGGSPLATQVQADVGPLRTVFVTLFFSAIGMLADPAWIAANWYAVLATLAGVMLGNATIVWALERAQGMSHRHAIASGLCLAQIGEFSFVLATMARSVGDRPGLLSDDLFNLMVSVSIGSLFVTPYLIAYATPIGAWMELRLRRVFPGTAAAPADEASPVPTKGHLIIIGFGPAGRSIAEVIDGSLPLTVIDLNPRTVLAAREHGISALVGDAGNDDVITHAHVRSAKAVVVTLPDHRAAISTVERIRALCPNVPIIARARYHVYVGSLRMAGAQVVVDEETSVGERLGEAVRKVL